VYDLASGDARVVGGAERVADRPDRKIVEVQVVPATGRKRRYAEAVARASCSRVSSICISEVIGLSPSFGFLDYA
jgi:hypothetical protein